jgi:uncharacterized protein YbbK (DUF523 family)
MPQRVGAPFELNAALPARRSDPTPRHELGPSHLPTPTQIERWPTFTPDEPLRVLVSGCLAGSPCGADGTSYGEHPLAKRLLDLPSVRAVAFCPEEEAFGTPRATPDIHGGDGFDVLDGRARVISDAGVDWTRAMLRSAIKMKEMAEQHGVHLALLMDISAACGSTVIYDGARRLQMYRRGPGVAAAALIRTGIPVVSQRDERTLGLLFTKVGVATDLPFTDRADHYARPWYRGYFRASEG